MKPQVLNRKVAVLTILMQVAQ